MQKHLRLEIVFGLGFGLWALGRERERERAGVRSFETEKMSLHKNLLGTSSANFNLNLFQLRQD